VTNRRPRADKADDATAPDIAGTDSKKARVARAWLRAGDALGYALRSRDVAKQWPQYGDGELPRPLSVTVHGLFRDGILRRVDDQPGGSTYVHVDAAPVRPVPVDGTHFRVAVLLALAYAAERAQRFVTTRDVTAALPFVRYHGAVDKQAKTHLWQILRAEAAPRTSRVPGAVTQPGSVHMATTTRPGAGDPKRALVYWWCPASLSFAPPKNGEAATAREAAIQLTEEARHALGHPTSATELSLYIDWVRATGDDNGGVRALDTVGLTQALKAARLDGAQGESPEESGVRVFSTPYTAGRLVPVRFGIAAPTAFESASMTVCDMLLRVEPARECALLESARENSTHCSPAVTDLVALRRVAMRDLLTRTLPADQWPAMIAHQRTAVLRVHEWISAQPVWGKGSGRGKRMMHLCITRMDDLNAVEQILSWRDLAVPERFVDLDDLRVIGDTATITFDALAPLERGLDALQRGRSGGVHPVFRRARRIPMARAAGWRIGVGASPLAEQLDRVDALSAAIDLIGAPVTTALVGDAMLVLGTLLRDVRVVQRVLDASGPGDQWVVRGLLVAAGLLAEPMTPARWIGDEALAEAGVLGLVVSDPDGVGPTLRRLLPTAAVAARRHIAQALAQVECGEWLALLG